MRWWGGVKGRRDEMGGCGACVPRDAKRSSGLSRQKGEIIGLDDGDGEVKEMRRYDYVVAVCSLMPRYDDKEGGFKRAPHQVIRGSLPGRLTAQTGLAWRRHSLHLWREPQSRAHTWPTPVTTTPASQTHIAGRPAGNASVPW